VPIFQKMAVRFNRVFGEPTGIESRLFEPDGPSLAEAIAELGIAETDAEIAYWKNLPRGIQASLRALIYDDLSRENPVHVTIAWLPSYDYELTVMDAPGTALGPGGITVIVKSRYPLDRHPSEIISKS
jgi:hypothetical protein